MLPGIEMMGCTGLAVPAEVMHHVVKVESSYNPYAIGVVGGHLVRQPRSLSEAVATVRMLVDRGYNFSLGLAQVNRYNLNKYGLDSYEEAFEKCANLQAGSRILAECNSRAKGDWSKAFSCYYSGNFTTGFRHGYVQKVVASWRTQTAQGGLPIPVVDRRKSKARFTAVPTKATASRVAPVMDSLLQRRTLSSSPSAIQPQQSVALAHQQAPVFQSAASGVSSLSAPTLVPLQEAPVQVQLVGASTATPPTNNLKGAAGKPQPVGNHTDNAFVF